MARGIVLLSWSVELKIAFALRVRKQSLSAKSCRAGLHPSCMLCCLLATIVRSDDFQEVRSSDLRVWGFLLQNELRFFLETYSGSIAWWGMPYALCPMPYALCTSGTSCYWERLYIVSGCITIIKSSQQLTLNHWVFPPLLLQSTVNSQQSTVLGRRRSNSYG